MVFYHRAVAISLITILVPGVSGIHNGSGDRNLDQTQQTQTWSHAVRDSAGVLYCPRAADFRPRYDEDETNQSRQSWRQYWKWIQTFYSGNLLARGWTRECEVILEQVQDSEQRIRLTARMNILGRMVVAEWAKDNAVRRIGRADIRQWRSWLRDAAGRGQIADIQPLLDTLGRIETLVIQRLGSSSLHYSVPFW
jgi:hypothetical protein